MIRKIDFRFRIQAWGVRLLGFAVCLLPVLAAALENPKIGIKVGPVRKARLPVPDIPIARWFPDGHIPMWRTSDGWQMYLAGSSSYRTVGFRRESLSLSPSRAVLNPGNGALDNGGAWLYAVTPLSGSHLVGFYHAENHQCEGGRNAGGVAWKSIARCESRDGGITWTKTGPILISSKPKPWHAKWGGNGDHCVVFDPVSRRWFCFFQEHALCMAVSDHPEGVAGTWKKWYRGKFSEPGLGGKNSPIPELGRYPGGNPSIHFNTFLQSWVMVWHTWSRDLAWSTSKDLLNWRRPEILLAAKGSERFWYPTIVGTSDTLAGEFATLYYGFWPDRKKNERQFVERPIRFVRPESPGPDQTALHTRFRKNRHRKTRAFGPPRTHQVYVVENPAGKLYIGLSQDVSLRLRQHNDGVSRWTRGKGPWKSSGRAKQCPSRTPGSLGTSPCAKRW